MTRALVRWQDTPERARLQALQEIAWHRWAMNEGTYGKSKKASGRITFEMRGMARLAGACPLD